MLLYGMLVLGVIVEHKICIEKRSTMLDVPDLYMMFVRRCN